MDLGVALFVAAYLGVVPRARVEQFRALAARVPVAGALFAKAPTAKAKPSRRKAAAPKKAK